MKKNIYVLLILFLVIIISIFVMIIPTFFTKGISRVVLNKEFDLPLVLNDEKDVKLLFFGYSGCTDVCAPRLNSLDKFYKTLSKDTQKRVGVEFLDISVAGDENLPESFATSFNESFKGIYLNEIVLRTYTKMFEVYFSKSLFESGEYDHTTNLYLVKKAKGKKKLRYMYKAYPYDYKQINLDIKELLDE